MHSQDNLPTPQNAISNSPCTKIVDDQGIKAINNPSIRITCNSSTRAISYVNLFDPPIVDFSFNVNLLSNAWHITIFKLESTFTMFLIHLMDFLVMWFEILWMFFEGAFLKHQASSRMRTCENIKIRKAKIMKIKVDTFTRS